MSPYHFIDINTFRFIYSRIVFYPLRVSLLILQPLVFKMDLNRAMVNITKVIASKGCLSVSLKSSLHTERFKNCLDERAKRLFYPNLIMFLKCRPIQK